MRFRPGNPVGYCSRGSGAVCHLSALFQQGASSQCGGGGGWGLAGQAFLAPFPPFGRVEVTCPSKTSKKGVEESHIPLGGTGERAF